VTCYTEGFSHFVTSMTAPVASGWSGWPGGACTHWKAPPCHGAHVNRSLEIATVGIPVEGIPALRRGILSTPVSQMWAGLDRSHYFQRPLDLRKFRCRREAFERRSKSGVGLGVATGRAVELGERDRPGQLETADGLLL
jgi:hypothetical protein